MERIQEKLDITLDDVVTQLARVGFLDVRQLFDSDGKLNAIADLREELAVAISGIDIGRERTTTSSGGPIKVVTEEAVLKVRLSPRVEALVALARILMTPKGMVA